MVIVALENIGKYFQNENGDIDRRKVRRSLIITGVVLASLATAEGFRRLYLASKIEYAKGMADLTPAKIAAWEKGVTYERLAKTLRNDYLRQNTQTLWQPKTVTVGQVQQTTWQATQQLAYIVPPEAFVAQIRNNRGLFDQLDRAAKAIGLNGESALWEIVNNDITCAGPSPYPGHPVAAAIGLGFGWMMLTGVYSIFGLIIDRAIEPFPPRGGSGGGAFGVKNNWPTTTPSQDDDSDDDSDDDLFGSHNSRTPTQLQGGGGGMQLPAWANKMKQHMDHQANQTVDRMINLNNGGLGSAPSFGMQPPPPTGAFNGTWTATSPASVWIAPNNEPSAPDFGK